MGRAARPAVQVKHLTEAELAEREGVSPSTAATWRKNGSGPPHLPLSDSATKATIRYRLADIEAWELSRLVPAPA